MRISKYPGKSRGFTLIELIIAMIVLGILAALAIPQFAGSADDAREAALRAEHAQLRHALQRYWWDHDEQFPDSRIVDQLTRYTNGGGQTREERTPAFRFGPYLSSFPENPLAVPGADPAGVHVVSNPDPLEPDANPTTGWKYNALTGEIIPNTPG